MDNRQKSAEGQKIWGLDVTNRLSISISVSVFFSISTKSEGGFDPTSPPASGAPGHIKPNYFKKQCSSSSFLLT